MGGLEIYDLAKIYALISMGHDPIVLGPLISKVQPSQLLRVLMLRLSSANLGRGAPPTGPWPPNSEQLASRVVLVTILEKYTLCPKKLILLLWFKLRKRFLFHIEREEHFGI